MAPPTKRSAPRFGVYRPTEEDAFHVPGTQAPELEGSLRVGVWNIHFGAGTTSEDARRFPASLIRDNLDRIAAFARDHNLDVLALQEVDRDSHRSGDVDQLEHLRVASGLRHAAFATTWDAAWVPHPIGAPPSEQYGRMWSGQAVISRFPILEQYRHGLAQPARFGRVYNTFYLHRCVQELVLDLGAGRRLTLFNVHLEAFDMANRRAQARTLAGLMSRTRGPALCVGDLNTVPPEATQRHRFADEPKTDFRGDDTLPTLRATGWRELGDASFTFPADRPNRRLDHAFSSPGLRARGGEAVTEPASDHLPMIIEVEP